MVLRFFKEQFEKPQSALKEVWDKIPVVKLEKHYNEKIYKQTNRYSF